LPPTGIYQRLIDLVDRIRASAAYTDEIGVLLGIIPSTSQPLAEVDLKPVIEVSEIVWRLQVGCERHAAEPDVL
jgi:hypothetical protein